MAVRASWSGSLRVGRLHIPVKLYQATEEKAVSFKLLHEACGSPITQERRCSACGPTLGSALVRGYEVAAGQMVRITDEELKNVPLATSRIIEVLGFLTPKGQPDVLMLAGSYYVKEAPAAARPFGLLMHTLASVEKTALVRVALGRRERIGLIKPRGTTAVLTLLHWPDEVREDPLYHSEAPVLEPDERGLAREMVQAMTIRFRPKQYTDRYYDALMQLIRTKRDGGEIERVQDVAPQGDFMDLMEQTIEDAENEKGGS
jgi:DNA end-binding protein Ku